MSTQHEQTAVVIRREIEQGETPAAEVPVDGWARQGDLIIDRRIGDAADEPEMPDCGIMVVAGRHGEHRVIAPRGRVDYDAGTIHLPDGGIVVHTDVPDSRHGAVQLPAGVWPYRVQRELGLDDAIVQVAD